MQLFNTTSFRVIQEGLDGLWLKQQVISQNIANADTPGYKAKYVNFSSILKEKENASKSGKSENELHVGVTVTQDNSTNQLIEGSNVDEDQQNLELAKAQLQYDTLLSKMTAEFSMLRIAMK